MHNFAVIDGELLRQSISLTTLNTRFRCGSQIFLLNLREEGFAEPHKVGFAQLDVVAAAELQHRPLRRELERSAGRVRPSWELVDLQLALEEARLELLGWRLADLLSVRTQASVDPRAASVNVVLSAGLHSKHGFVAPVCSGCRLVPGAGIE